jgi:hypothetical protein
MLPPLILDPRSGERSIAMYPIEDHPTEDFEDREDHPYTRESRDGRRLNGRKTAEQRSGDSERAGPARSGRRMKKPLRRRTEG